MNIITKCLARLLVVALSLLPLATSASKPCDAGASSELTVLVEEIERGEHGEVRSLLVRHRGVDVLRCGWPAQALDQPWDLRSASKSVVALLLGAWVTRQGEATLLEQAVAANLRSFTRVDPRDPRRRALRVEHLLAMRSGLACDDLDPRSPGNEQRMYLQQNWLAFWMALPMQEQPGRRFSYCAGNLMALADILEANAGQPLQALADVLLFAPLGINDARFALRPEGGVDAGGHLRMSPRQLLALGELLRRNGRIGEQVMIGEGWLQRMLALDSGPASAERDYRWLWWRQAMAGTTVHYAWGSGGQFLFWVPELDLLVVSTADNHGRPEGMQPLRWMETRLIPALR